MGSSAVDLERHNLALLAAKGDVVSGRAAASWALFAYEKSNQLKLLDSGAGGPEELAKRFRGGSVMYGLCRLPGATPGQEHVVLISWVGEKVSEQRRAACAGHLPAIRAFFKEAQLVVKASQVEEVTREGLQRMLSTAAPPAGSSALKKGPPRDSQELVGTNYKKINPVLEILHTKRSSFWAQAEREEEERRQKERQQAQEERRRWEWQRMEEEARRAAEREQRIQEKEQHIQEHRKQQAQREAEERQQEEAARRRAAAVAPQPTSAPRDLFRPRERAGSASGSLGPPASPGGQPGAPRRPFLRHQRSLTESAYIFQRPDPGPSRSPGGFLPSASPGSPPAAPLPRPHQSKPPPPVSPKPGPAVPSPCLGPSPLPIRAESPPAPTPLPPLNAPGATPLPAEDGLANGTSQVAGVQCLPPLPPAEPGSPCAPLPPSFSSPPGPPRASTPPGHSPPPARPPPLPCPAHLASPPEAGPVVPSGGPGQAAGLSIPSLGGVPLLEAPPEEPVPSPVSSGPSSACSLSRRGGTSGGEPPRNCPAQAPPAETPPPGEEKEAPAAWSPSSPEQGVAPEEEEEEEEEGTLRGQEPGAGGQGASSAEAGDPEAAVQDPGAGNVEENRPGEPDQEGLGDPSAGGACLPATAET